MCVYTYTHRHALALYTYIHMCVYMFFHGLTIHKDLLASLLLLLSLLLILLSSLSFLSTFVRQATARNVCGGGGGCGADSSAGKTL